MGMASEPIDLRRMGVEIRGQRYALGELLLAGGGLLQLLVTVLGLTSWVPWFTLDALGVTVRTEGAGLLGWLALCCTLGAVWTTLALRVAGNRLPKLPFKRTIVPLAFAGLSAASLLVRYTLGESADGTAVASWNRAFGATIGALAGLVVLAGAVLEFVRDPDSFITE